MRDPVPPGPAGERQAAPPPSRLELFVLFSRIAALSFGGVLPWARFVLVERRKLLSAEEFTDLLALCQLLPGPNIVNMSVVIGGRHHGPTGAVAAALGLLALPVAIALTVAALYDRVQDVPAVARALQAMAAAAAGLVIAMAVKMGLPILRARFRAAAPAVALTFVAVALLQIPLLAAVLAIAPVAILLAWRAR